MVGAAMGLASRGAVPFPTTFACFLERAADFIRMAGISETGIKLAGTHCGVSIGEDGPSQMALEDLATMRAVPTCTVLYPCDGNSAERLIAVAASTPGPVYLRMSRPKTPVIYDASETFVAGGSKLLRQSDRDVVTIVAAGVTVHEALKAHEALSASGIAIRVIDAYCVQPIDRDGLVAAGKATGGRVITVEDHYAQGGLGDAVAEAVWDQGFRVRRLAVREIPRSGEPAELLDRYGISSRAIVRSCARVGQPVVIGRSAVRMNDLRGVFSVAALAVAISWPGAAREQDPAVTAGVREAAWSPDGKRVAVSWFDAVWTMTPEGRDARRLAPKPEGWIVERDPAWSADGKSIAFSASTNGQFDIVDRARERRHCAAPDVSERRRALAVVDARRPDCLFPPPGRRRVATDDRCRRWRRHATAHHAGGSRRVAGPRLTRRQARRLHFRSRRRQ